MQQPTTWINTNSVSQVILTYTTKRGADWSHGNIGSPGGDTRSNLPNQQGRHPAWRQFRVSTHHRRNQTQGKDWLRGYLRLEMTELRGIACLFTPPLLLRRILFVFVFLFVFGYFCYPQQRSSAECCVGREFQDHCFWYPTSYLANC